MEFLAGCGAPQAHRVVVVVLGGLPHAARKVDREPAVKERLHGQAVVRDRALIDLLTQLAELPDNFGARAAGDLLPDRFPLGS